MADINVVRDKMVMTTWRRVHETSRAFAEDETLEARKSA
jgi:hypothetical protein